MNPDPCHGLPQAHQNDRVNAGELRHASSIESRACRAPLPSADGRGGGCVPNGAETSTAGRLHPPMRRGGLTGLEPKNGRGVARLEIGPEPPLYRGFSAFPRLLATWACRGGQPASL